MVRYGFKHPQPKKIVNIPNPHGKVTDIEIDDEMDDLEILLKADLMEIAKDLGLSNKGTKKELVKRIQEN